MAKSERSNSYQPAGPRPWVVFSYLRGILIALARGGRIFAEALFPPRENPRPRRVPHRRGLTARIRAALRHGSATRRWFAGAGVACVGAVTLAALLGFVFSRGTPGWWKSAPTSFDPAQGEALENAVMAQLSAMRPADRQGVAPGELPTRSETWTVAVAEADVNAWLNTRLKMWLANRRPPIAWPGEVREIRVRFEGQRLHLGIAIADGAHDQIVGATVIPSFASDGSLWLPAERLDVGALPVPPGWALGWARSAGEHLIPGGIKALPELDVMLGAIAGKRSIVRDAVVRIDGGRRVRLLKFVPRDGYVEVTCRTEHSPRAPQGRAGGLTSTPRSVRPRWSVAAARGLRLVVVSQQPLVKWPM